MKNLKSGLSLMVILSLLMACLGLGASAVDYDNISSMENLLEDGGFESGLGSVVANEDDGTGLSATLTQVSNQAPATLSNRVIEVVSRTGDVNSGLCYDVTSILKEKDGGGSYKIQQANGCLYVAAKIKLKNPADTVYVRPVIFGWAPGGMGIGSLYVSDDSSIKYTVTGSDWSEIGTKTGAFYRNFAIYEMTPAKLDTAGQKIKLMFTVAADAGMSTPYTGGYYIDDVSLFFVEGVSHLDNVTREPSLLQNSDFETLSAGNPIDYSATTEDSWTGNGTTTWFASEAVIANKTLTEADPSAPVQDAAGVRSGQMGLLVTNRPGPQQGVSVNMKPIVTALGALKADEKYHLSVFMKAKTPGTTIQVTPIWGAGGSGNAYLNGNDSLTFAVTDQWTEVGFNITEDEYYAFHRTGETPSQFNPEDSPWTSIRFKTDGTQDYYVDDFKVMKYLPPTQEELNAQEAQKFMDKVESLFPITLDKKEAVQEALAKYRSLSNDIKALCNTTRLTQAEADLQKLINAAYLPYKEPGYKRGDNLLFNGGFEKGFLPAFYANQAEDTLKSATITLVSKQNDTGESSQALYVRDREPNQKAAGPQYDMLKILKNNGAKGTYYMSAKVKLDNPDDTAYICPYLQGGNPGEDVSDDNHHSVKLMLAGGTAYPINGKEYTEIGLGTDGAYIPFSICDKNSGLTEESIDLTQWFKFHFQMYTGATVSNATPAYSGNYLLDDVTLWFVPEGSMPSDGRITVIGPNLLDDGTFETDYDYDAEPRTGSTWFPGWVEYDDGGVIKEKKGCVLSYKTTSTAPASTVDAYGVHGGNYGVKVTNRPGAQQGVALNMKSLVDRVGPLKSGENYYISCYMRAEPGQEFYVIPIFGTKANEGESNANGYVGGAEPNIKVTDKWTHVGFDITKQQYLAVMKENKGKFDPYGRDWASIRFQIAGETYGVFDNYYIDDVSVWVTDVAGGGKTGDVSHAVPVILFVLSAVLLFAVGEKRIFGR